MQKAKSREWQSSLVFYFSPLLLHLFSSAGHLAGFILVGKVFSKACRILGLEERKGRWLVEQDCHGNLQVNVAWFFAFFWGVPDWGVLILVWFERFLHSALVNGQSCPLPLKLMTSQAVEGTLVCTDGSGGSGANGLMKVERCTCTPK